MTNMSWFLARDDSPGEDSIVTPATSRQGGGICLKRIFRCLTLKAQDSLNQDHQRIKIFTFLHFTLILLSCVFSALRYSLDKQL